MCAKFGGVGGSRDTSLSMNASSDTSHVESQTSIILDRRGNRDAVEWNRLARVTRRARASTAEAIGARSSDRIQLTRARARAVRVRVQVGSADAVREQRVSGEHSLAPFSTYDMLSSV